MLVSGSKADFQGTSSFGAQNRRIEEAEVARVLAMRHLLVSLGDAKQRIELKAIAAGSAERGFDELGRIDVVLRPVLAGFVVVGMQYALA